MPRDVVKTASALQIREILPCAMLRYGQIFQPNKSKEGVKMKFRMSYSETKSLVENPSQELVDKIKFRLWMSDDPESKKTELLNKLAILEMGLTEG